MLFFALKSSMANQPIAMHLIRKIYRLQAKGVSKLQMSRQLHLSRNTVKKYLRFLEHGQFSTADMEGMSDEALSQLFHQKSHPKPARLKHLETLLPDLEKELRRVGVTRRTIWEEYRARHPDGYMFTQFCHHFRQWQRSTNVVMRLEHKAGDKVFLDFSGKKFTLTDPSTGEVHSVETFVAVLGASQLTYVEAVPSQQKEDFIGATERALRYFGGVPACIVTDNLKAAVHKSNKYEPSLNETFADFADHYDTVVIPTRSYKPRDKALVENAVRIVYQRIYAKLRKRVFHTIEQLNTAIWEALEVHNLTPFQNRPYSRRELFEQTEQDVLQALPKQSYTFKHYAYSTVYKNTHVYLRQDKHYYSVPHDYVGRKVKLIFSTEQVDIYYRYQCIAQHPRQLTPYAYSTVLEHLPPQHQFVKQWSAPFFLEQGKAIGVDCLAYLQAIIDRAAHPEHAFKSCQGVLSLQSSYDSERLNKACRRALHFEAYSYHTIRNILEKGWDKLPDLEDKATAAVVPIHANIRGKEYYQ